MATQTNITPTTVARGLSFADRMIELSTGIKLLIDRLDTIFDVGLEFPMEEGKDVMDATIAAQWIAQRLIEDIRAVGREFDQDPSNLRKVKFAQAAE